MLIITTTSSLENAEKIAKVLVEEKIAACVNIVPKVISYYIWENKLNKDEEFLLIVKTTEERAEDARRKIKELHNYQLPEVIFLRVDGGESEYLKWIFESVKR
ncbi:MAG: divalent-cation tolerance protein CutA [Sulfolobaceae archaeon]